MNEWDHIIDKIIEKYTDRDNNISNNFCMEERTNNNEYNLGLFR